MYFINIDNLCLRTPHPWIGDIYKLPAIINNRWEVALPIVDKFLFIYIMVSRHKVDTYTAVLIGLIIVE